MCSSSAALGARLSSPTEKSSDLSFSLAFPSDPAADLWFRTWPVVEAGSVVDGLVRGTSSSARPEDDVK